MHVIPLGTKPDIECHVIRLDEVTLLFDCGSSVSFDAPHSRCIPAFDEIHMVEIDAIFISNHNSISALPYLTEYMGYSGPIYATQPTMDYGRLMMEEMLQNPENDNTPDEARTKDPNHNPSPDHREIFMSVDIEQCLAKMTPLFYEQVIPIVSSKVTVRAISSGYCIGGCNWVIQNGYEKTAYITASASSANRHPEAIDINHLMDSDIMIMSQIYDQPDADFERMLGTIGHEVAQAISCGGTAIVLIESVGAIVDVIEFLYNYLNATSSGHESSRVPMYFISPIAVRSLELADSAAAWLCASRKDKVHAQQFPFLHRTLIEQKILHLLPSTDDFSFPKQCIVLCGDTTLRTKSGLALLQQYGPSRSNALLFTHHVPPALPPGLQLRVVHSPIDVRLNCEEVHQLVLRCQPKHLMVSHNLLYHAHHRGPNIQPLASILNIVAVEHPGHYATSALVPQRMTTHTPASIPIFLSAQMSVDFARSLTLERVGQDDLSCVACHVTAQVRRDPLDSQNRLRLSRVPKIQGHVESRHFTYGHVNPEDLVSRLGQAGFSALEIYSPAPAHLSISIKTLEDATIECFPELNMTQITTTEEAHRVWLKNIILPEIPVHLG